MEKYGVIRKVLLAAAMTSLFIGASAAAQVKDPGTESGLTAQDKDNLAVVREAAARVQKVMEGWVATRAISAEKLFAYLYYPIADTAPKKYHTDFDEMMDRDVSPIQEEFLPKLRGGAYLITVDKNGYCASHNKRFAAPLTGNRKVDLTGNRTKRIFADRTGILSARNKAPFLFQTYKRDTGETLKEVTVPVIILGKHWGAIRSAYKPE